MLTATQPAPWLALALAELGQHEEPGDADNPRIVELFAKAGHPEVRHDEIAWCAAFVGAMLETAGVASTGSLLARSYLTWGAALQSGRPGAIAVFRRSGAPGAGHVAFWLSETADRVTVLGGNQGDAVSITSFAKADLLGLRWPAHSLILTPTAYDETFNAAVAHVLSMEGGWTDDPIDPGGPTNHGITLATYAAHNKRNVTAQSVADLKAELQALTADDAKTIYRVRYWRPSLAERLPPPLALMHFDAAVNHGVGGAARLLQQALNVDVDGEIGPLTMAAATAQPISKALERYAALRQARYRSLGHFWRFGRGWLARVDATLTAAQALASKPFSKAQTGASAMSDATPKPIRQSQPADLPDAAPPANNRPAKWWGHSITIWGTLITALTTVLPLLGPALGFDIKPDAVRQLGDNLVVVAQAVAGLAGTIMALYGRSAATTRLERRSLTLQV
jgi:uncharacterized protein (TIGR02594 family)